jgi:hypothetical protein
MIYDYFLFFFFDLPFVAKRLPVITKPVNAAKKL